MNHLQLTSEAFTGAVDIYFNDKGLLTGFDTNGADLSESQQKWLLLHMPLDIKDVRNVIGTSPTAKLTDVTQPVTFDMFWNRYDDKITTNKKRTEKRWDSLSKIDQVKAFNYIQRYFLHLPAGTRKLYPETYLNSGMWNN